ncbi:PHD finger protein 14 [Neocloeon triangulifer]|uniref:PHD finger protein 14 n=1 Tax=Neocloeon triangulifer TaxID=2078957 RepID=UPI00286F49F2|nr:PHD finger protein 14 [Neocloeon triangulifer]
MESGKVNFLIKTMVERDPQKRKVKPVQNPLLDFDLGESSDDSDFRIEDHNDSGDDSINSNDDESDGNESDDENGSDDKDEVDIGFDGKKADDSISGAQLLAKAEQHKGPAVDYSKIMVCCACLGDRSDSVNEIVECDSCGVMVHEACYGVSDTCSVSSTASSCSTEPWFCEACKAGVTDPCCELCPNKGGIFKETDVGKWVHLVCGLYVPGVAFGEVDKLSNVTLFEMAYNKWGAKPCTLCPDERFVRTGITIGCDAGMCRETFHVTCAQREGLLAEAHSDEFEHADPFYAHCKQHTDKFLKRKRRRNWLAVQMRMRQRHLELESQTEETAEQRRIKRKLLGHSHKYKAHKKTRPQPWMPTQKMSRLITTSFSACISLLRKSEIMGINVEAMETEDAQIASIIDARKKWHIPPAFTVEYVAYYLDRNARMTSLRSQLQELLKTNSQYSEQEKEVQAKYNKFDEDRQSMIKSNEQLLGNIRALRQAILSVCPSKKLPPDPSTLLAQPQVVLSPIRKENATKHKTIAAVASQSFTQSASQSASVTLHDCGACRSTKDQHLLAKCDTCKKHYHLGCLNPPLTRMPKKTKLMGWQCTDCDKLSSGSEPECLDPEAPRKLRRSQGTPKKDGNVKRPRKKKVAAVIDPSAPSSAPVPKVKKLGKKRKMKVHKHREHGGKQRKVAAPALENQNHQAETESIFGPPVPVFNNAPINENTCNDLVKHEGEDQKLPNEHEEKQPKHHKEHSGKHKRNHGDKQKQRKDKEDKPKKKHRKKKHLAEGGEDQPRIKITIKPIMPGQYTAQLMSTQFESTSDPKVGSENHTTCRRNSIKPEQDLLTQCDKCSDTGSNNDLVRCDECRKCFHFCCLEPPLKKSPKRRGYSWHCADCDPTDLEN